MNRKQRKVDLRTILLMALLVCALIAALILLVRLFGFIRLDSAETQDQSQQSAETFSQTDRPASSDREQTTGLDLPAQPFEQTECPASSDREQTMGLDLPAQTFGGLTVYYEDSVLHRVDGEGNLATLLPNPEKQTVRLDMQPLDGVLKDLEQEEIQRLAVGLLQSYYVDAPETASITAVADESLQYAWSLEVPATGGAPALSARVRFLEADDGLWYLLLLWPSEEEAHDALITAYETATAN